MVVAGVRGATDAWRWSSCQVDLVNMEDSKVDTGPTEEERRAANQAKRSAAKKAQHAKVLGFDISDMPDAEEQAGPGAGSPGAVVEAKPLTPVKRRPAITSEKPWYVAVTGASHTHSPCRLALRLTRSMFHLCRKLRQSRIPWYLLDELEAEKLKLAKEKAKPLPFQARFPPSQQIREDEADPDEFRWGI